MLLRKSPDGKILCPGGYFTDGIIMFGPVVVEVVLTNPVWVGFGCF